MRKIEDEPSGFLVKKPELEDMFKKAGIDEDFIKESNIISNLLNAFQDVGDGLLVWLICLECEKSFHNFFCIFNIHRI